MNDLHVKAAESAAKFAVMQMGKDGVLRGEFFGLKQHIRPEAEVAA